MKNLTAGGIPMNDDYDEFMAWVFGLAEIEAESERDTETEIVE
jgi:hypothetical protein